MRTAQDVSLAQNVESLRLPQGRLQRQIVLQQRPSFRRVKTGFRAAINDGESKAALQREFATAKLIHHETEVEGVERLLSVHSGGDALGFCVSIGGRVLCQQ